MRTVSLRLADLERSTIPIGFQGENLHTQVRIDCKMIFKDYPASVVSLAVTPPQGDPYPVMVIRDGDIVAWNVTASDTAYHGDGRVQFTFVDGEEVIKTVRGKTSIAESDEPSGTAPTPIQNWITIANVVLDEVAHAVEAALHAPIIDDNGYWAVWDADAEEYVATEYKAQGTDGHDGVGIVSIEKTGTSGLVDTYTITFTSGNPVTYTVTNGRDGNDGISPTATVTKSGKVATITITDKNGTTSETVSDGADADPAALIDDTAGSGATGKTWSADKIATETSALLTGINSKPVVKSTDENDVDLDVTDASGNVILRLRDGHVQTLNFSTKEQPKIMPSSNVSSDLDLTDTEGNVILRLENGNVKTKNFDSTDPYRVPDYYHANGYLKGKCDRFNYLMRSCEKISDSFAFFTDMHWDLNAQKSPALLRYIKENTRIDKFFCGGDVSDFRGHEDTPYNAFTHYYEALQMPIYTAMGNHDYYSIYGTEGRVLYSFNSVGRDRIGNFDRNYFYVDNPQSKIRYVFMNGFAPGTGGAWDWGLEQDQIDWLEDTALDLESGWGALIITHMTHAVDYSTKVVTRTNRIDAMLNVLDGYAGNGEIIAVISGHTHLDYLDYSTGGIPILVTTCDKYSPWIDQGINKEAWLNDRVEGTITEQAIDLYIIDREAKQLTRVRVGCPIHYGADPETWTEYEDVTISYDRS